MTEQYVFRFQCVCMANLMAVRVTNKVKKRTHTIHLPALFSNKENVLAIIKQKYKIHTGFLRIYHNNFDCGFDFNKKKKN